MTTMNDNKKTALIFAFVIGVVMLSVWCVQQAFAQPISNLKIDTTGAASEQADAHVKAYLAQNYASVVSAIEAGKPKRDFQFSAVDFEEANVGITHLLNNKTDDRLSRFLREGLKRGTIEYGAVDLIAASDGVFELDYQAWRLKHELKKGDIFKFVFPLSARSGDLVVKNGTGVLFFKDSKAEFKNGDSFKLINSVPH